jgi:hypothetical protein
MGSNNSEGVFVYDGTEAGSLKGRLNLIGTALTALLGWRGRTFRGTTTARNAFSAAGLAQTDDKWYSTTDSITYRWSGAAWKAYSSEWTSYTPTLGSITLGNGSLSCRWRYDDGDVLFEFNFNMGSTSAMGTDPTFTLPIAMASTSSQIMWSGKIEDSGTTQFAIGFLVNTSTTVVTIRLGNASVAVENFAFITSTSPMTWTTNDNISISGRYRLA